VGMMKGVSIPRTSRLDIDVPDAVKMGSFANAFRVVEETGPDCFLDFLVYSAQEHRAEVVARVRVRRELLPAFRDLMEEVVEGFGERMFVTGTN
jgi:hypothetical protein